METHAPRRPRSTTSTLMPRVEGRRGPAPAVEALDRVEQPAVIVRAEMFTPQPQPKVPREQPSAVARAGWITGLPEILLFVQDCDRQLRIVRPGSAVHVVGPDQGHDVIDDHHLGVDVDRIRVPVLQVEDREPIRRHLHEVLHHRELAESTGGTRDPAVAVRVAGHDDDQAEVGSAPQRLLIEQRDLVRPEVLVLDVDQGSSAVEDLRIDARDASLAVVSERVGRSFRRIGSQDLDGVPPDRRGRGPDGIERRGLRRFVRGSRDDPGEAKPVPLERRRVVPPFPERFGQIGDSRPTYLRLEVVPRRMRTIGVVQPLRLGVPPVLGVVPSAVAQVDPADEGDLPVVVDAPDEDELLVVGSGATHPLVQQHLAARLVHGAGELALFRLVEPQRLRV